MKNTIKYITLSATRDWLFIALYGLLIISISLSSFLGGLANFEPMQMSVTYISASSRIIIVSGMIIFVSFAVARLFSNKEFDLFLSKPIARSELIISLWLAFSLITALLILPLSIFMMIFIKTVSLINVFFWCLSLFLETLLVTSFAILVAIIVQKIIVTITATIAFYLFSRLIGFLLLSLENGTVLSWNTLLQYICEKIIFVLSILTPRLDLFTNSSWLVYSVPGLDNWHLSIIQVIIYIPLLLIMAIYDINKKQF